MNHGSRGPLHRLAAHLLGTLGTATLPMALAATPVPTVAQTVTPVIWAEMEEMRPPCTTDICFRDLAPPGLPITGTGFGPYAPILIRFVSLDGTRASFVAVTEADTAAGDFALMTGEPIDDG